MAISVTVFNSAPEFKEYVEKTINESKVLLGDHMKSIEEIRIKYERSKKRHDTLKKLTGKAEVIKDTKQLDVGGFKVLVNPTADYELTLMEEAITSLQEKLNLFEKAKEMFPALIDESMKVGVVLNDGVPTGFMLYMQD